MKSLENKQQTESILLKKEERKKRKAESLASVYYLWGEITFQAEWHEKLSEWKNIKWLICSSFLGEDKNRMYG